MLPSNLWQQFVPERFTGGKRPMSKIIYFAKETSKNTNSGKDISEQLGSARKTNQSNRKEIFTNSSWKSQKKFLYKSFKLVGKTYFFFF